MPFMALGIIAALLLSAPPSAQELAQRRARIAEIHQLADMRDLQSIAHYVSLAAEAKTPWERSAAMQALMPHHKERGAPLLAKLLKTRGLGTDVRLAAAVKHYQWTQSKDTLAVLVGLRGLGASLRRAFQHGHERGRPLYHPGAAAFFTASAGHPMIHTKMDGALGLIELGAPHKTKGLQVLEAALFSKDAADRAAAVRYMSVSYDEPAFKPLLQRAVTDSDLNVRAHAEQILQRLAP